MTSHTISLRKAESQASSLEGSRDTRRIEGLISAQRLARRSVDEVLESAKKLVNIELGKSVNRDINDAVKLDIALTAIQSKRFGLAEYFLQGLFRSKNSRVRAGAYNALGVIALRDQRIPEAVQNFRAALKANSSYKPALLNLGFIALKGGDLKTAKRSLLNMQSDWFVQYGMISIARLEGNRSQAANICERLTSKKPKHKAVLFNCGLHEYQTIKNFKKARTLIDRAAKERGGDTTWDERAFMVASQIDYAEATARRSGGGRATGKKRGGKK